jgi:hypothetical protein
LEEIKLKLTKVNRIIECLIGIGREGGLLDGDYKTKNIWKGEKLN